MDGDGSRVGDLGDVVEPLDVVEEGEELTLDDRIEREQTSTQPALMAPAPSTVQSRNRKSSQI